MTVLIGILCALCVINLIVMIVMMLQREKDRRAQADRSRLLKDEITVNVQENVNRALKENIGRDLRDDISRELKDDLSRSKIEIQQSLDSQNAALRRSLDSQNAAMRQQLDSQNTAMRQQLDSQNAALQKTLDSSNTALRRTLDSSNTAMRQSLDSRLEKSFTQVNDQLNQVFKGIGEMQAMAGDVGDLKKVLSNVKTRGILGEIQLGAILSEILTPDQYAENVAVRRGASERVEFAVKLPGQEEGEIVYLPIDAKFPSDLYAALSDAREEGDKTKIDEAAKMLQTRLKTEARKIRDKYIHVPETTDFGIMFLPAEGLYAEAVQMGMLETLQHEYKVTIAGPSTMAALLNSLQMGFRTLAVQKHSAQVWKVLENAKAEFAKFESVLNDTQNRMKQASDELDKLVGVRTRQINRALKDVQTPDQEESS